MNPTLTPRQIRAILDASTVDAPGADLCVRRFLRSDFAVMLAGNRPVGPFADPLAFAPALAFDEDDGRMPESYGPGDPCNWPLALSVPWDSRETSYTPFPRHWRVEEMGIHHFPADPDWYRIRREEFSSGCDTYDVTLEYEYLAQAGPVSDRGRGAGGGGRRASGRHEPGHRLAVDGLPAGFYVPVQNPYGSLRRERKPRAFSFRWKADSRGPRPLPPAPFLPAMKVVESRPGSLPGRLTPTLARERAMNQGIAIIAPVPSAYEAVLSPAALEFVAELERLFGPTRQRLLAVRADRQAALDAGELPDFLPETADVRAADWKVAPAPADLRDRRVEITGPVDRKMIINALNSGASVFMADFEDSNSPTWDNNVQGQLNLRDAVRRTIEHRSPQGKRYALAEKTATLMVRPRGWHLSEKHMLVDGKPVSASFFDFGLYFFHNARRLLDDGTGPYFYLPKLESHLEARLWNEVFEFAEEKLGIPPGTTKATVLIETILAAFEMDEILHELRDHSAGLNCGRWDYIFSFIKKFRERPECLLPDRGAVTMTTHFLRSYSHLLIRTCHRRGAHAMGGMAAQIPIKDDPVANYDALAKVVADKRREASDGHDGTWVAHPGLVPVAMEVFDGLMPGPHQIDRRREDVRVTAADLLAVPEGKITERGLRTNISIGIQYLEAWLRGQGCVPLYNLMEDAATAEISRAQVWQWIRHEGGTLDDGRRITVELVQRLVAQEMEKIRPAAGSERFASGRFDLAASLFLDLVTDPEFTEFLTLPAYDHL